MRHLNTDVSFDNSEDDEESFFCNDCGREFAEAEFEFVDTEFDQQECRCPTCQFSHDLQRLTCDFCEQPAEHALGSTFYCEDHFDDLVGDD
jgi:DNA-directed RNA polymerase subunit RPC12/RpoP